ncbi:MAG TPA: hypothetical protein VF498_00250, partial [Anaerolineales bacterium]
MPVTRPVQRSSPWQLRLGERRVLLIAGDFVVALAALVISLYYWWTADRWLHRVPLKFLEKRPEPWYFLLPLIWIVLLVELYDVHRASNRGATIRGVALAAGIGIGAYSLLYLTSADPYSLPRRGVAAFILAVVVLTLAWRMLYIRLFTAPQFLRRVLLVGGGRTGEILLKILTQLWPPPFSLVG